MRRPRRANLDDIGRVLRLPSGVNLIQQSESFVPGYKADANFDIVFFCKSPKGREGALLAQHYGSVRHGEFGIPSGQLNCQRIYRVKYRQIRAAKLPVEFSEPSFY